MRTRAATFIAIGLPLAFALISISLPQFDEPAMHSAQDVVLRTIGILPDSADLVIVGVALMGVRAALRAALAPSFTRTAGTDVGASHASTPTGQNGSPAQNAHPFR